MSDKLSRIKSSGSFRRNVAKNYLKIVQTHPRRKVETLRAVNQPFQNAFEPTTNIKPTPQESTQSLQLVQQQMFFPAVND